MHKPTLICLVAFLSANCVTAQDVATPPEPDLRVLIDRDLNARQITLLSITEESIAYLDDLGRTRQASVGGLVALLPVDQLWDAAPTGQTGAPSGESARTPGILELDDGQRFTGEYAATGGDEDAITWTHPAFGRVTINLDRVARAVLNQSKSLLPRPASSTTAEQPTLDVDELILANGDRLTGYVISMGDPIEIEVGDDIIMIPAQRIAQVRLANPNKPMQGLVAWLDDGSVVVVATIDGRDGESIELALPTGQRAVFPAESLDAVAFSAGKLQGLAFVEPDSQQPIGDRRTGEPTRILNDPVYQGSSKLRAPDIEIPGPMRIEWSLPEGTRRLATIAEMPFDAIPWGDCVLSVQIDSIEQASQRINSENPRFEINIPIDTDAKTLTITVEPGRWGPINDRITLRRPLLLLDNDPS